MFRLQTTTAGRTTELGRFGTYPAALSDLRLENSKRPHNVTYSILEDSTVSKSSYTTTNEELTAYVAHCDALRAINEEPMPYAWWWEVRKHRAENPTTKWHEGFRLLRRAAKRAVKVPPADRCVVRPNSAVGVAIGHAANPPADASPLAREAYGRHRSTMAAANLPATAWGKWFALWSNHPSRCGVVTG